MQNIQAPSNFSTPYPSRSSCLASVLQGPNFRITHTPPSPLCHGKESYWVLPVFHRMISGVHPLLLLHFYHCSIHAHPQRARSWQHCLTVLPVPDLFLMPATLHLNYDLKFLLLSWYLPPQKLLLLSRNLSSTSVFFYLLRNTGNLLLIKQEAHFSDLYYLPVSFSNLVCFPPYIIVPTIYSCPLVPSYHPSGIT